MFHLLVRQCVKPHAMVVSHEVYFECYLVLYGRNFFDRFDGFVHLLFGRERSDAHADGSVHIKCTNDFVYFGSTL